MKKVLLLLPVIFLLAAGCNTSRTAHESSPPLQSETNNSSKLDIAAENLIESVTLEERTTIESDSEYDMSDTNAMLNSSEEVTNAAQF